MNNKKTYITIVLAIGAFAIGAIVVGYLLSKGSSNNSNNNTNTTSTDTQIAATDVATHNSKGSCWMIISGSVYDVTKYIKSHPGGNFILDGCGKDATDLFNGMSSQGARTTDHSNTARNILKQYKIGVLSN